MSSIDDSIDLVYKEDLDLHSKNDSGSVVRSEKLTLKNEDELEDDG